MCVWIYVYIYIYIYIHVYIYVYVETYTYLSMNIHIYVYMYIHIWIYTYIYMYKYAHNSFVVACLGKQGYFLYIYVNVHLPNIHTYIWKYKYIWICTYIQPIPLGVTFSKAQISKLERLFCHVTVKRDVRALSFELWHSIRKCHPKWDRLYI